MRGYVILVYLSVVHAGFYDCTDGVECTDTYGAPIVGQESDLESACDADASCISYQWNTAQSYGVRRTHTRPPPA